jgi:hypothetical protein
MLRKSSQTHRTHSTLNLKENQAPNLLSSIDTMTYRVSVYVCCFVEYVSLPLPVRSKHAVIVPSFDFLAVPRPARTLLTSQPFSFTASSASVTSDVPQHFFACLRKLEVDFLSSVFRYRRTIRALAPFPKQCGALHLNSWQRRPSTYAMEGRGSKNA